MMFNDPLISPSQRDHYKKTIARRASVSHKVHSIAIRASASQIFKLLTNILKKQFCSSSYLLKKTILILSVLLKKTNSDPLAIYEENTILSSSRGL